MLGSVRETEKIVFLMFDIQGGRVTISKQDKKTVLSDGSQGHRCKLKCNTK